MSANAAEFTDGVTFEPKTPEDYEFLFGPIDGPLIFVQVALYPLVGEMRVSSVDEETHTIYLEPKR